MHKSSQASLLRETFKQLLRAMGRPDEANELATGVTLARDLEEIVPKPDDLSDDCWDVLVGRCQKLAELRKIQLCLVEESMKERDYICCEDVEEYINIKIDEKSYIEDTITMTLRRFVQ